MVDGGVRVLVEGDLDACNAAGLNLGDLDACNLGDLADGDNDNEGGNDRAEGGNATVGIFRCFGDFDELADGDDEPDAAGAKAIGERVGEMDAAIDVGGSSFAFFF